MDNDGTAGLRWADLVEPARAEAGGVRSKLDSGVRRNDSHDWLLVIGHWLFSGQGPLRDRAGTGIGQHSVEVGSGDGNGGVGGTIVNVENPVFDQGSGRKDDIGDFAVNFVFFTGYQKRLFGSAPDF